MADVLHRTTKRYIRSVNTPDFPSTDWIINPDLSAVARVPQKYWKIRGDAVEEMDDTEKAAVDQKIADNQQAAIDASAEEKIRKLEERVTTLEGR